MSYIATSISLSWVRSTQKIFNIFDSTEGTGFLVGRETQHGGRVFLVTNKHVLGELPRYTSATTGSSVLHLGVNANRGAGIVGQRIDLQAPLRIHGHPDPHVDVAAIDVTHVFVHRDDLNWAPFIYDQIPTVHRLVKTGTAAGDPMAYVGYPKGLRQGDSYLSLVRAGSIASTPGLAIIDEQTGTTRRAFLIDTVAVPGSSGSPVVLSNRWTATQWAMPVGILAQTHFVGLMDGSLALAGLAVAYDIETARETIDQFYQPIGAYPI